MSTAYAKGTGCLECGWWNASQIPIVFTSKWLFISRFMFMLFAVSSSAQCSPRTEGLNYQASQTSPALDHNMKDWRLSTLSEVEKLVWGENLVLSALVKVCSFLRVQCQSLWRTVDRVNWYVMQYVHFSGRPMGCAKGVLRTVSLFAELPVTSKSYLLFLQDSIQSQYSQIY